MNELGITIPLSMCACPYSTDMMKISPLTIVENLVNLSDLLLHPAYGCRSTIMADLVVFIRPPSAMATEQRPSDCVVVGDGAGAPHPPL